jgi:RecB family exonuclease
VTDVVLSASSLNVYLDCPLQWYFSYVLAERGETSLKKVIGAAVHEAIEKVLKHLAEGAVDPTPDVERIYHRAFDIELAAGPVKLAKDDGTVEDGRESGLKALTTYLRVLASVDEAPQISKVEEAFEIEVNGIGYSGAIDRLDALADPEDLDPWRAQLILRDTKVTHSRPRPGKYRLNMIGYALGVEHVIAGRMPNLLVLDYIVRTKEPYYWPEYIDPPSATDVDWFAAQLEQAAEGIDAGRFEPLGLSGAFTCAACPHQAICGPYQRFQQHLGN